MSKGKVETAKAIKATEEAAGQVESVRQEEAARQEESAAQLDDRAAGEMSWEKAQVEAVAMHALVKDLLTIDAKARKQGHSLVDVLAKAAKNAFGIDVRP